MTNSSTINIRFANSSDVKQIATCHVISWQKIYRGHIPDTVLDSLSIKEREQTWHDLLNNNVKVLVLVRDDYIIGFASICSARDKDTDAQKCGEISAIYLHPDFWHQGLGRKLCLAALSELEMMGFSEVIVWALIGNEQARKFYVSLGFTETDHRKLVAYNKDVILNEVRYQFSFKPLQEISSHIRFEKATLEHQDIIFSWLAEPHMQEFWDNSQEHKDDILNFIHGRKQHYFYGTTQYWLGYIDDQAFCFLLSDQMLKNQDDLSDLHRKYLSKNGHTISLDFGIGNKNFLGKGLAAPTLKSFAEFYKNKIDSLADTFFIDPNTNNPRAFHVYEKAGFEMVGYYYAKQGFFKEEKSCLMVKNFLE